MFGCCSFQYCLQIVSENRTADVKSTLRPWQRQDRWIGGALNALRDAVHEVSHCVISVQSLLGMMLMKIIPWKVRENLVRGQTFLLWPQVWKDRSFHACWMQDVLCYCWKASSFHKFRDSKQSLYKAHTSHTYCSTSDFFTNFGSLGPVHQEWPPQRWRADGCGEVGRKA